LAIGVSLVNADAAQVGAENRLDALADLGRKRRSRVGCWNRGIRGTRSGWSRLGGHGIHLPRGSSAGHLVGVPFEIVARTALLPLGLHSL
jgi:hypothetical protein